MKNKPNFSFARKKANEILLMRENSTFPISPEKVKIFNKNIIITSFSNYIKITGTNINELTNNGNFKDGYTITNIRPNTDIIFYNDKIESHGRIRWTIAHEIGHIVLNHKEQCDINEIEANTFASQLLLPQCILEYLIQYGSAIDANYIENKFGLSHEASLKVLQQVGKKIENGYNSEYDDIILDKFKFFLEKETIHSSRKIREFDDEMQQLRNNWL